MRRIDSIILFVFAGVMFFVDANIVFNFAISPNIFLIILLLVLISYHFIGKLFPNNLVVKWLYAKIGRFKINFGLVIALALIIVGLFIFVYISYF